jgi:hypothetical protein
MADMSATSQVTSLTELSGALLAHLRVQHHRSPTVRFTRTTINWAPGNENPPRKSKAQFTKTTEQKATWGCEHSGAKVRLLGLPLRPDRIHLILIPTEKSSTYTQYSDMRIILIRERE